MKIKRHEILLFFLLLSIGCERTEDKNVRDSELRVQFGYVGRNACKDCHKLQYDLFIGSDHDDAMDVANESTVLGDFNETTYTHLGVTSRFYKKNDHFYVTTEGPDGQLHDYHVTHTLGIRPLQQYLVEFPGGRYQMLPLCWDTRPKKHGGQRWFHIYGQERIAPNDILFWTRMAQNYNYMCSECHSTHVRKNYDRFTETYFTTWSEIDVSCEACHGPGSEHVRWADAAEKGQKIDTQGYLGLVLRLKESDNATWIFRDQEKGTAERTVPLKNRNLIDMCGRCHARRTIVHEDYEHGTSLLDTHRPGLLEENLYFADGQILEEVYVYGSFLQSKMYMAGVTCKDCHEPHSGKIYLEGNALCYRCHMPAQFALRSHHFHDPEQSGGLCVECHMPERTYMVVDPRRDHSMRVPRPDLSERLETPNACIKCHASKSNQWATEFVKKWYDKLEQGEIHYGEIFYAGRRHYVEAQDDLIELANDNRAPMIRATALHLLGNYPTTGALETLRKNIQDPDPLIRAATVGSFAMVEVKERFRLIKSLLKDPVRLVRIAAAQSLVEVLSLGLSGSDEQLLQSALEEYKQSQYINADHETAHLNLGVIALHQGDYAEAESCYKKAIEIEPLFVYSYINLADLYRLQGREADAEKTLQSALTVDPDLAEIHHALGLAYVRQRQVDKALTCLKNAAELSPETARFTYVYAIGLSSNQRTDEAIQVLEKTVELHPYDRDILFSLATMNRDLNRIDTALVYAAKLVNYFPDDLSYQQLAEQLRALKDYER
ncbi:tetratricopeptide repeat protein [candidate division KSB1 bacterium]|nr:tetratricopeptide repeat protein [candidate division KSB1 bacterium]RQW07112.1 MAG: tetratricopeptide repeat protein [candidate division KSB1 bacterium]